jgi:hypothetical protein
MNTSETIKELAPALCAAQAAFRNVPRTKEVLVKSDRGSYAFKYAPLDEIVAYIRPILAEHGLMFTQAVKGEFLVTTIMHKSGEWIADSLPIKGGSTSQAYGSELTYKRRYSVTSMLGLVSEDDDDARQTEQGEEKAKKPSTKATREVYDAQPIESQVALNKLAKEIEADFYTKGIPAAFSRYSDAKTSMGADEQLALWHCVDAKVRSSIKKHGESLKQAA